jgi:hypothetical protein
VIKFGSFKNFAYRALPVFAVLVMMSAAVVEMDVEGVVMQEKLYQRIGPSVNPVTIKGVTYYVSDEQLRALRLSRIVFVGAFVVLFVLVFASKGKRIRGGA